MRRQIIFVISVVPIIIIGFVAITAFVLRSIIPFRDQVRSLDGLVVAPLPPVSGTYGSKPADRLGNLQPNSPIYYLRILYGKMNNYNGIDALDELQRQVSIL